MRRDMDVIRRIVLALNDANAPIAKVEGMDEECFLGHAQLLIEAGLAVGSVSRSGRNPALPGAVILFRLTWDGHNFANSIGDETFWEKTKAVVINPTAGVAFDVLLAWLKSEALKRLGLS